MVKITFDRVEIADTAAELYRNFIQIVVAGKIPHGLENILDGRFIDRFACESTVEIDQMQSSCTLLEPVQSHFCRILRKYGSLVHIALSQPYAGAIFQINSGNKQHDKNKCKKMN